VSTDNWVPGPAFDASPWEESDLPQGIVEFWRTLGLATSGDGFLRAVDPGDWIDVVVETWSRADGGVPLFTTALGDIIVWQGGAFHDVRYRQGFSLTVGKSLRAFLLYASRREYMVDPDCFDAGPYFEALPRIAGLARDECLAYVPLLGLGGQATASHLAPAGLREHALLVASLVGPVD